ncbi:MAG: hypothetical protein R3272_12680, partial [Candidatus Promineifilaceae bacterium]|nr:hypothetical protein [Candidatus Promineifilaceae bacterium]
ERQQFEIWKPNRQVRTVPGGWTLRIQRPQPFHLRWSADDWESSDEIEATGTALGIFFADLPAPSEDAAQKRAFSFTFYYPEEDSWEGQKYRVIIEDV